MLPGPERGITMIKRSFEGFKFRKGAAGWQRPSLYPRPFVVLPRQHLMEPWFRAMASCSVPEQVSLREPPAAKNRLSALRVPLDW
jgi:hypothetical protein